LHHATVNPIFEIEGVHFRQSQAPRVFALVYLGGSVIPSVTHFPSASRPGRPAVSRRWVRVSLLAVRLFGLSGALRWRAA